LSYDKKVVLQPLHVRTALLCSAFLSHQASLHLSEQNIFGFCLGFWNIGLAHCLHELVFGNEAIGAYILLRLQKDFTVFFGIRTASAIAA